MPKWFSILLCVGLSSIPVSAAQFDDFTYEVTPSNTVTITDYTGPGGDIAIPSTIASNSVTRVGDLAFDGCTNLTSVTIPDSVTSIGNGAFEHCSGLTSLTIPNSITNTGTGAFSYCTSLTSITIPDSVTSIGDGVFRHCSSLTSLTILDSVTSIGISAFSYCTNLTSLTIPDSVNSIGRYAFSHCSSLTNITVDLANPSYSGIEGVLFNKAQTTLVSCGGGRSGVYSVPNSVSSIGNGAFEHCSGLTSITIPDSVSSIGSMAFLSCSGLTSITIPDSVTNIGTGAFYGCLELRRIYFAGRVPTKGLSVFAYTDQAMVYYLPGTTGWGSTYGGCPAVLWNPVFTAVNLKAGEISCTVTGTTDIPVALEVSTNLAAKQWTRLCTTNLSDGMSDLVDSSATNQPTRFYRIVGP